MNSSRPRDDERRLFLRVSLMQVQASPSTQ